MKPGYWNNDRINVIRHGINVIIRDSIRKDYHRKLDSFIDMLIDDQSLFEYDYSGRPQTRRLEDQVIAAIQRVSKAAVHVNGEEISSIQGGLLILLGVAVGDTEEEARILAAKCAGLRIFDDEERHMNRSITDARGSFLVISQFTLLADCRKGRRPSFTDAAPPEDAEPLVEIFVDTLKEQGFTVKTGIFGARMEISLVNSGPVTIILDSGVFRQSRRKSKRDGT